MRSGRHDCCSRAGSLCFCSWLWERMPWRAASYAVRPMSRRVFALLLPVYVPSFLMAFTQGLLIPTLPLYATTFGVSFSLVSLAVAAKGIGTLVTDLPSGVMLERFGSRKVMLLGVGVACLSLLLMGLIENYYVLVLLRLVSGAGTAMWMLSRMAFISEVIPLDVRGRALSAFGGVSRIGVFASPAIGGFVGANLGLQTPFLLAAVLAGVALVITLIYVPESRTPAQAAHRRPHWRTMAQIVRTYRRDLFAAGSAQILAQMIRAGRELIVPLYGATVLGLDVAAVGVILTVSAAIDMSLFGIAGLLQDRMGRKWASVPSMIILGTGMAMVPLTAGYASLLAAAAIMGLGNGLGSGTMMTLGSDLAPRDAMGEFLGLWRLIGDGGNTGGPLVVGAVADLTGLGLAAIVLAGVGALAASNLAWFVPETRNQGERRTLT